MTKTMKKIALMLLVAVIAVCVMTVCVSADGTTCDVCVNCNHPKSSHDAKGYCDDCAGADTDNPCWRNTWCQPCALEKGHEGPHSNGAPAWVETISAKLETASTEMTGKVDGEDLSLAIMLSSYPNGSMSGFAKCTPYPTFMNNGSVYTIIGRGKSLLVVCDKTGDPVRAEITYDADTYVFKYPHTHEFSYELVDATLTATCSEDHCDLAGEALGLTLSIESGDYSGSAFTASFADTAAWESAGLTVPTFTYAGRDGTIYAECGNAPVNPGAYVAKAEVGIHTIKKNFEITGSIPAGTTPNWAESLENTVNTASDCWFFNMNGESKSLAEIVNANGSFSGYCDAMTEKAYGANGSVYTVSGKVDEKDVCFTVTLNANGGISVLSMTVDADAYQAEYREKTSGNESTNDGKNPGDKNTGDKKPDGKTPDEKKSMSAGAVVAIVLGSVVVVLAGAYAACYFLLFRKGLLAGKKIEVIFAFLAKK